MHDRNREFAAVSTESEQREWNQNPISERTKFLRPLRRLLAKNAEALARAAAAVNNRPVAEKLTSEVLPLADACRWLERNAARVLAARGARRRDRPFWLRNFSFEVQRQPFGRILIIGPRNYPLFLPAVQALHGLVAGNLVLVKPAPGTRRVMLKFAELIFESGLDPSLLSILDESVAAADHAIASGIGKVFFTGSSENGRALLTKLAPHNIPAVLELSGEDAVIVVDDADLDLVVRAIRFGVALNAGESCIAPRRIIALQSIANELDQRLRENGLANISLVPVPNEAEALSLLHASEFALGVSIFSRDVARAQSFARQIQSGFVLINDLIVPTADPRLPFGGIKKSGFGVTRGEEGLREMTHPHVVATRRGKFYHHFEEGREDDLEFFSSYIQAAHGRARAVGLRKFLHHLWQRARP